MVSADEVWGRVRDFWGWLMGVLGLLMGLRVTDGVLGRLMGVSGGLMGPEDERGVGVVSGERG